MPSFARSKRDRWNDLRADEKNVRKPTAGSAAPNEKTGGEADPAEENSAAGKEVSTVWMALAGRE